MFLCLALPGVSERMWSQEISQSPLKLGRSQSCEVTIKDRTVSRFHASIWTSREGTFVRDLNSRNGTRVNGERVSVGEVHRGDTIHLGQDLVLEIDCPGEHPTGCDVRIDTARERFISAADALGAFRRSTDRRISRPDCMSMYALACRVYSHLAHTRDNLVVGNMIVDWLEEELPTHGLRVRDSSAESGRFLTDRSTSDDTAACEENLVDLFGHGLLGQQVADLTSFAVKLPGRQSARTCLCDLPNPVAPEHLLRLEFAAFLSQRCSNSLDHERLTALQRSIIEVIRDSGRRLTTDGVLSALDARRDSGNVSIGVTKQYLAELVKRGILDNKRPGGYGIRG